MASIKSVLTRAESAKKASNKYRVRVNNNGRFSHTFKLKANK